MIDVGIGKDSHDVVRGEYGNGKAPYWREPLFPLIPDVLGLLTEGACTPA